MQVNWSAAMSEWLLRRPVSMAVALVVLTAVAVILVAHWPDSYATNAAFLVIGAWVSIIGMVVVDQSQRLHDKEALSKVLHAELADQPSRLVHDAERALKPGAERQPWNAFRLRKFAPVRARIYEASAGSLSMLDAGDAGAISRFYYRVDAMARDLNQIADQAGENVTATQVKLIQKRLRQAIVMGLPALEGIGARVPGAASVEQEAVDGYLEEGEASDVGGLRARARSAAAALGQRQL